ncbi:MAG: BON domain-containing protein [Pseudomonadota bacterium]
MQKSKLITSVAAAVLLSGLSMGVAYADDAAKAKPAGATVASNAVVSDETITTSAKAALSGDAQVAALPINVTTKKGVVLLSGEVPSAEAGDRVVQLIATVDGVKEVKNDLKVKAAG